MDEIEEYVRENKENIIEFHVITSKYNRGTVKISTMHIVQLQVKYLFR